MDYEHLAQMHHELTRPWFSVTLDSPDSWLQYIYYGMWMLYVVFGLAFVVKTANQDTDGTGSSID